MDKLYDVTSLGEMLIDFTMNGKSEQGIGNLKKFVIHGFYFPKLYLNIERMKNRSQKFCKLPVILVLMILIPRSI